MSKIKTKKKKKKVKIKPIRPINMNYMNCFNSNEKEIYWKEMSYYKYADNLFNYLPDNNE